MAELEQQLSQSEEARRKSAEICRQIEEACELIAAAQILSSLADRKMTDVKMNMLPLGENPRTFQIVIPEGVKAHITDGDDIVDERPKDFLATSLEHLGTQGTHGSTVAIFTNHLTGLRLTMEGLKFDVYPLEDSTEV